MLTVKLLGGIAGVLMACAIFAKLLHSRPIPRCMQLILALVCLVFGGTYFIADLWIRPFVNRTAGLVQMGFVAICASMLIVEFEFYPPLSTEPDILSSYLLAISAASFLGSEQESVKALILGGLLESHIWYQTPAQRRKSAKDAGNSRIRCGNDARRAGE